MSRNKILITGLGRLGAYALEFLCRQERVGKIYVGDVDEELARRKINNAMMGAITQGYSPDVEFVKLDLLDVDETAELLTRINPDLVLQAATVQPYWILQQKLPKEIWESPSAKQAITRPGAWLPMSLTLPYNLMRSIKKAKISPYVVQLSIPDYANAILGKVGLEPTVGAGNPALCIPWLKLMVREKLNVPVNNVSIYLVANHAFIEYLFTTGKTAGIPYFMKIMVGGRDVTNQLKPEKLMLEAYQRVLTLMSDESQIELRAAPVAASAVANMLAILDDTGELMNAAGPAGLPGGYPVRLSAKGAEVVLPDGITLDEAVRINREAMKWDGIEAIKDDGTVVFTDAVVDIMSEKLGYVCKELKITEAQKRYEELKLLLDKLA